ncbi:MULTISPECIES: helix-turn-helix domain-containing protein [unclassified Imperialibacter]|uniref:AraC family transcriptional regulator n=1 Tax=unclassified Imperialibacter TaxID=2629706 RepID=UPI0012514D60|nr:MULTISPECIES: helix-turn-helix domain-containing protein [unclassified Imperialibacter]CAD5250817.1 AraC family transcriptional regulator [Imperialibacter sp. 75]CAD5285603.1 AraC family transcriptional regulator [Imperialibacter sp. 89]VVT04828.1 AraC family transcriptional regulator [Imperialibacter sp. EC-SDR9]
MEKIPVRQIRTTDPQALGLCSIRRLEDILQGKELLHALHRHTFFFVLAVSEGKGVHEIDFVPFDVLPGSVFFLRPGQVHRLQLAAGSRGYLMEFDQEFYASKNQPAAQRLRKASSKNYCLPEQDRFEKLKGILSQIFEENKTRYDGYHDVMKASLEIFCIEYGRQSVHPGIVTNNNGLYTQERFEELLALLEAHISQVKQASQYADLLNLSPYQLNAITKASVGKTVAQMIDEQIILEAKRYLLATPNQVKDIAWDLGYEDVSYFIRFFKKHTGHSPDAFRKNFR